MTLRNRAKPEASEADGSVCGRGCVQDDETALSLLETVGLTELTKRYTLDDAEVRDTRHQNPSQPDGP